MVRLLKAGSLSPGPKIAKGNWLSIEVEVEQEEAGTGVR